MKHIDFMQVAIRLAQIAEGTTSPNPAVGAVIVKDNQIIANGRTGKDGSPHAEYDALTKLEFLAQDAELYVTLEPCCHIGKNPACTDVIIKSGIKKVYIACLDQDVRVKNKAVSILKDAGIEVEVGLLEAQASPIYQGFFSKINNNRPFIALKIAASLDGKIALSNNKSKWITSDKQREHVHFLRKKYEAILTTSNTIIADDPLLTCRLNGLEEFSPIRIILDRNEVATYRYNKEIRTIIFSRDGSKRDNFETYKIPEQGGLLDLNAVFSRIAELGVNSVLIEAGGTFATNILKSKLYDKIYWYQSKKILGNDAKPAIHDMGYLDIPSEIEKLEVL